MNLLRRRDTALLFVMLITAFMLWIAVIPSLGETQVKGMDAAYTSVDDSFVSLQYLTAHFAEFRGASISTIGIVKFYASIYQFEDFWLKGQGNATVPVVMGLILLRPDNDSLVKISGTIMFSNLEGGFYYLNATSITSQKNVILLGWDGVQRNHLYELKNRGLMPNLASFLQEGKIVNVTVTDHYTDTKAGWTQILTGYKWGRTGIFSNHHWFHSIPYGYTIPERLEKFFGKNEIATAFIAGKLNHMETINGTGSAAHGSPFSTYSNEAIYSSLPSQLDLVSGGDIDQDRYASVVGPLTLQFLENNAYSHFFAFFHFSDPDHIGHMHGENSIEYEQSIEACDYWLGQIRSKLNTLNIAKNTLIYITNDHGFDEGSVWHSNAPYVVLATNDKNVIRDGDEVDVAPTVYYGLGLWNYSFTPNLDGFPLQVNLPESEAQHRQTILADTEHILFPTMNITSDGMGSQIVTFNASDNNLATVFILVDKKLKADGPWIWNKTNGMVTASGSYIINITGLGAGSHTVQILAFDEHGANNGDPNQDSLNGGSPAITSMSFIVTSTPTDIPEFPIAFLWLCLFAVMTGGLILLKRKKKSIQSNYT